MNENSMEDGTIRHIHSFTEQQPHIDNEQHENLTQNQPSLTTFVNVNEKMKNLPMTPTALYISFFSFSIIII